MTINEAITLFYKNFPDKKVTGYWKKPDGYILNIEGSINGCPEPGQFAVTNRGEIYGTNPINSKLDFRSMILIHK